MQNYSCLMSAALQSHEDIVDLLLSNGAAINAQADDVYLFAPCDPPPEYPPEYPPKYACVASCTCVITYACTLLQP